MASVAKVNGSYKVRWKELLVVSTEPTEGVWDRIEGADGPRWKRWVERSRTFSSRADADEFAGERTTGTKRGERWQPESARAVATIGSMADAYVEAAEAGPHSTWSNRRWHMRSFCAFVGRDRPVTDLSATLLEAYAKSLPNDGRKAATRHRKVFEAQHAWEWGRRRPDRWPGVPPVVTVVGPDGTVQAPPPVVRVAVPSIDDVDQMLAHVHDGYRYGDNASRALLIMRYTGLRRSQVLHLHWADIRMQGWIVVRAGVRGAKRGRTRAIPLHPGLRDAMAGWGPREGYIFADYVQASPTSFLGKGAWLEDAARTAWQAAGVPREKWGRVEGLPDDAPGARAYDAPLHSIRAAVRCHFLAAGVSDTYADYLIGHATDKTKAAYVPEESPTASPHWRKLCEAVSTIPRHDAGSVVLVGIK